MRNDGPAGSGGDRGKSRTDAHREVLGVLRSWWATASDGPGDRDRPGNHGQRWLACRDNGWSSVYVWGGAFRGVDCLAVSVGSGSTMVTETVSRAAGPAAGGSATEPARAADNMIPRLRRAAGTTPGRLTIFLVGLIVLSVATGVAGLVSVQAKANSLHDLTSSREPVTAAAEEIYRSLSDADVIAASSLLSGVAAPAEMRHRYNADIEQAGVALAVATTDIAGAPGASAPITALSTELPVYTGLIERALANNEQGLPVGSAYLREAHNVMQYALLVAAGQLYAVSNQLLIAEQDNATSVPWVAVVSVVLLLGLLVWAQRYLRRKTNRVLNVGLLLATIAVAVSLLWACAGLVGDAVYVTAADSSRAGQLQVVIQARVQALAARTQELLALVARSGDPSYDQAFTSLANDVGGKSGTGGLLGEALQDSSDGALNTMLRSAGKDVQSWVGIHEQVISSTNVGDYQAAATKATLDTGAGGEATVFSHLDTTLGNAIQRAREDFISKIATGEAWLIALPEGVLALSVLAGVAATVGVWQRLREYR